jgi:hypothetical protein
MIQAETAATDVTAVTTDLDAPLFVGAFTGAFTGDVPLVLTGAATGVVTLALIGAATGVVPLAGAATGAVVTVAVGTDPETGTSGSATGAPVIVGAATGTSIAGAATGTASMVGAATGVVSFICSDRNTPAPPFGRAWTETRRKEMMNSCMIRKRVNERIGGELILFFYDTIRCVGDHTRNPRIIYTEPTVKWIFRFFGRSATLNGHSRKKPIPSIPARVASTTIPSNQSKRFARSCRGSYSEVAVVSKRLWSYV